MDTVYNIGDILKFDNNKSIPPVHILIEDIKPDKPWENELLVSFRILETNQTEIRWMNSIINEGPTKVA